MRKDVCSTGVDVHFVRNSISCAPLCARFNEPKALQTARVKCQPDDMCPTQRKVHLVPLHALIGLFIGSSSLKRHLTVSRSCSAEDNNLGDPYLGAVLSTHLCFVPATFVLRARMLATATARSNEFFVCVRIVNNLCIRIDKIPFGCNIIIY